MNMVLAAIGFAGIVVLAGTCPGIVRLFPAPHRRHYTPKKINPVLQSLLKKGYITYGIVHSKRRLLLTETGQITLLLAQTEKKTAANWDGTWRIVVFDIPERKRGLRSRLRTMLKQLGFCRLQNSVWITPHACKDILHLVRVTLGLHDEAILLETSHISKDVALRKRFHLA